MTNTVQLTIEGPPNAPLQVLWRSQDAELPPPIFEGHLGGNGRLTISVPCGYLVVVSPGLDPRPLHLENGPTEWVVKLTA